MSESLAATMQSYAESMVDFARDEFQRELDYSPESVDHVEAILGACCGDREHIARIADRERLNRGGEGYDQPQLGETTLAVMAGAYIGETLRRRWGGEWQRKEDGGARILIRGQDLNPGGLCFYRLTHGGSQYNVKDYFLQVSGKLVLAEPEPIAQQAASGWKQGRVEIPAAKGSLVLSDVELRTNAKGKLEISGRITNQCPCAWYMVTLTVRLLNANGQRVPTKGNFWETLRVEGLGKGETKDLVDTLGRTPLEIGRFSEPITGFELVLDKEHTHEQAA